MGAFILVSFIYHLGILTKESYMRYQNFLLMFVDANHINIRCTSKEDHPPWSNHSDLGDIGISSDSYGDNRLIAIGSLSRKMVCVEKSEADRKLSKTITHINDNNSA